MNFTMADIVAGRILYIHESEEEIIGDSFTFTASDGFNNVSAIFLKYLTLLVTGILLLELVLGGFCVFVKQFLDLTTVCFLI